MNDESPMERTLAWHRDAQQRDEAYLALGPDDMTEYNDPYTWPPAHTVLDAQTPEE